jgi:predicted esterase
MPYTERAERKIPMALWIGTADRVVPLDMVRATHKALLAHGFGTELREMNRHTHDYYGRASAINAEVWAFLQRHRLPGGPKYKEYSLGR